MRRILAAAACAALAFAAPAGSATAGQVCVNFSVTTPAGGTGAAPCLPVSPFNNMLRVNSCHGSPPVNTHVCVGFRVDLP